MAVHVISEKKYTLPEFKKKMENRLVGWELLTQKESRRLITLSVIYPRSITVYATNIESVARNCPVKAATIGCSFDWAIISCHILCLCHICHILYDKQTNMELEDPHLSTQQSTLGGARWLITFFNRQKGYFQTIANCRRSPWRDCDKIKLFQCNELRNKRHLWSCKNIPISRSTIASP